MVQEISVLPYETGGQFPDGNRLRKLRDRFVVDVPLTVYREKTKIKKSLERVGVTPRRR